MSGAALPAGTGRPYTIAVVNNKGGSGKSITALNLAGDLAARGERVLLIDLDRCGLTLCLTEAVAGPPLLLVQCLAGSPERFDEAIRPTPIPNLSLILSDHGYIERFARAPALDPAFPAALAALTHVDAVVIDTAPAWPYAFQIATAADLVVVPTLIGIPDFLALPHTLARLREGQAARPAAEAALLLLVPTRVRRERMDREGMLELRAKYAPLLAEPIPQRVAVHRGFAAGLPLALMRRASPAKDAYAALTVRVLAAKRQRQRTTSSSGQTT